MSVLKMYNPDQAPGGTLVLHKTQVGCCGDKSTSCKYFLTGDGPSVANPVTAITINTKDGPKVIAFDAPATTVRQARISIAKALKANGFDPYYEDSYKGVVVMDGYYQIIGEAEVLSITVNGVAQPLTVYCEMGSVCKFQGIISYAAGAPSAYELTGTGFTAQTLASLPTTAGDATAVKDSVEAALIAGGYDFEKVEVLEDTQNEVYIFKIHTTEAEVLSLNDEMLIACGCYKDFIGA